MESVTIEEDSLRDGLQFEKKILSVEEKLSLFQQLKSAGIKNIQVGSFVHPKIVPQMADTDEFVRLINQDTHDVLISGLVLNDKGLDRAIHCGLEHVNMSVSVSDTHSRKNARRSSKDALKSILKLIAIAVDEGIKVRASAQCAFGCAYEGVISENVLINTLREMAEAGASDLNLADTTGMANPVQVKRVVAKVTKTIPDVPISLHLHDTRGLGIANIMAAYELGVRSFDTSCGGLGGCPFVKGAAGNVATEDGAANETPT